MLPSSQAAAAADEPPLRGKKAWQAYQQTLPEMEALPAAEVLQTNVNVGLCVTTALGCMPRVQALRSEIAKLPYSDADLVDSLERYALALAQAHAQVTSPGPTEPTAAELARQARETRELMRQDLKTLALHGVLGKPPPKKNQRSRGHHGVAFELIALTTFLRGEWAHVEGKSLLTAQALRDAETLSKRLLVSLSQEAKRAAKSEHNRRLALRDRAFTLLFNKYEHLRRALQYLCWDQEDAQLPSLYSPQFTHKRRSR